MLNAVNRNVWISTSKGAILPLATLMLVMLMIVPVAPTMLDIGFIANIMISLAVLMVALNAAKPPGFSSFPTVLLFATLLRLVVNVASTRQIGSASCRERTCQYVYVSCVAVLIK